MPWKSGDASSHTKRANTAQKKKLWAEIANEELAATGDEGAAIRVANAAIRRIKKK